MLGDDNPVTVSEMCCQSVLGSRLRKEMLADLKQIHLSEGRILIWDTV